MNLEDIKILTEVETLLYEYPPDKVATSEDIQSALQILTLKVQNNVRVYGPWLAKAYVLNQQPDEAIAISEKVQHPDRWCWIWKAAAYALNKDSKNMLECLEKAVQLDSETYSVILGIKEFYNFQNDDEFLKIIKLPRKPTLDREIQELAEMLLRNQYLGVFDFVRKLEKTHADQASLIDAAVQALEPIVKDIKEHGRANIAEHWGNGRIKPQEFEAELQRFKAAQKSRTSALSELQKYLMWSRR